MSLQRQYLEKEKHLDLKEVQRKKHQVFLEFYLIWEDIGNRSVWRKNNLQLLEQNAKIVKGFSFRIN